jgi:hypothetical protein
MTDEIERLHNERDKMTAMLEAMTATSAELRATVIAQAKFLADADAEIERLKAALREIVDEPAINADAMIVIARAALEGK